DAARDEQPGEQDAREQFACVVVPSRLLQRGQLGVAIDDRLLQPVDALVDGEERRYGGPRLQRRAPELLREVGGLALGLSALAPPPPSAGAPPPPGRRSRPRAAPRPGRSPRGGP